MKQVYPALLKKSDSHYIAYIPDFNIYTQGADMSDVIEMVRDSIGMMGITMQDENMEVPTPSDYEQAELIADKNKDEFTDFTDGIRTMIDIDFDSYRRKRDNAAVRKNCTLPSWLNELAIERGVNFSQALQEGILHELNLEGDYVDNL